MKTVELKSGAEGSSLRAVVRLRTLIARAGGLLPHERKCPSCGGRIRITDDQACEIPLCHPQYRYDLGCRDNDCASVCGPSVAWCVRQWREEVARAKQPNVRMSDDL